MNRYVTITATLLALTACDSRTIDPGAACYGDTDGSVATGNPVDDLMPLPDPVPDPVPDPGPEPRPPMDEEPVLCKPDVWVRVHAFAAMEYYTVLECPLVHEDLAYYQHEYDYITEQAELCGVTADQLNENDDRAINSLAFICANRVFDNNPSGN